MAKHFLIIAWMSLLWGCTESGQNKPEPDVQEEKMTSISASQPLTFADIPNKNTVYETIETNRLCCIKV